jgi:CDGSH-type Zn-finger protein/uncharacterized Fe-S cluster protein YjdI
MPESARPASVSASPGFVASPAVTSSPAPPASASPASGGSASAPAPAPAIEEVVAEGVVLRFEAKRCIHARRCVLGAPDVFLANVKGPWLHPEAASLAEVAHACPSGAITYERRDGAADERAAKVNVARLRENGPLALHAEIALEGRPAMFRATLCRCGASKNKPFCDGAHARIGFRAD